LVLRVFKSFLNSPADSLGTTTPCPSILAVLAYRAAGRCQVRDLR
jgi:hypothetical protein